MLTMLARVRRVAAGRFGMMPCFFVISSFAMLGCFRTVSCSGWDVPRPSCDGLQRSSKLRLLLSCAEVPAICLKCQVANQVPKIPAACRLDPDSYLEVTKDDLESIALEPTRIIEIDECVARSEIDDLYLEWPYCVVPKGKAGHDAYSARRTCTIGRSEKLRTTS